MRQVEKEVDGYLLMGSKVCIPISIISLQLDHMSIGMILSAGVGVYSLMALAYRKNSYD
jgi:hypothetical protein